MKIKLGAVIPTVQYGNLQPEFEAEVDDSLALETFKELEKRIQQVWDKYGEKPLTTNANNRKSIDCFVGGSIFYDDDTHTYTNEKGEVYMSGSQYAKSLEKPFDMEKISQAMATKFGVEAKDIQAMWKLKAEISTGYGTAIHKALELYGRYESLAESLEKTTHLHDNPSIKHAVESFYKAHKGENAKNEIFIVDHKAKRAGQIDRLLVVGDKKCRVQDFKTNSNIEKSLPTYWVQLEFYAGILKAAGWEVEGLDIFHYNGEWTTYEHK